MIKLTIVQFDKIKAVYLNGRRIYYNEGPIVDRWYANHYKPQLADYKIEHTLTEEAAPVAKSGCVSDRACPPPRRWPYAPQKPS